MQTLLEVLAEIYRLETSEALRFSNGFRTWKLTYGDLYRDIAAFSAYLDRAGLQKGDRVIVWAENRPEWVTAFWAAFRWFPWTSVPLLTWSGVFKARCGPA
jgi:acyl-CoA synthetase (AMP-forming)/AMP-acid ligase II